ncbi:hypothetical protein KI387_012715, partial [Taxus chinensis]
FDAYGRPLLGLEAYYAQLNRQSSPSLSVWGDNYSDNQLSTQTPSPKIRYGSSFQTEEWDQLAQTQQTEPSGSNNMTLTGESSSSPQILLRPQISRQADPYLVLDNEHVIRYARNEQRSRNMYPPVG